MGKVLGSNDANTKNQMRKGRAYDAAKNPLKQPQSTRPK